MALVLLVHTLLVHALLVDTLLVHPLMVVDTLLVHTLLVHTLPVLTLPVVASVLESDRYLARSRYRHLWSPRGPGAPRTRLKMRSIFPERYWHQ